MSQKLSNDFSRRDLFKLTAGGLATSAFAGCSQLGPGLGLSATANARGKRPNVIVLFDDQLRPDVCGAYGGGGNITTPHINRLAREGMTFDNALSTCPLCTPYRGMLQTGRYPTHSGLVLNWVETNPNQRCIGHVFRDAGYHTGFIGKWHLAAGFKKTSGKHRMTERQLKISQAKMNAYQRENPESEYVPPGPQRLGYDHWQAFNFHCSFNNYFYYEDTSKRLTQEGYETDIQTDQAIEFMKNRQRSKEPFFLMIAPHPPHPPFQERAAPAGYLEQIPEELVWSPNVPPRHKHRRNPLRARCYHAMAKNVDDNVGRLIKFLDESGLSEDTILVFTSDHGEMLGSHGRENKMVPYAEAVNVPLIMRWPGRIPAGVRTDVLQTPMDHMPTLCGMVGLDTPDTADGVDLSSAVLNTARVDRDAVLMMNYVSNWDYFDTNTIWPEWRGLRTTQYTYAKWLTGQEDLYDNFDDPYQLRNLARGQMHLPMLKKMRARLKDLLAEAHDDFRPGTGYADWYDDERNLVKTALGPVG